MTWRLQLMAIALLLATSTAFMAAAQSVSLLSSGRWVKIKVKESGVHQITRDELVAMGFGAPEKVHVYGFSATSFADNRLKADRPTDILPMMSVWHGDKMLFYADGPVSLDVSTGSLPSGTSKQLHTRQLRNFYSDYATYFLTDSKQASVPAETVAPPADASSAGSIVTTSWGMSLFEEETENVAKTGARYLGPSFSSRPHQEYGLFLPGFNPDAGVVRFMLLLAHRVDKGVYLPVTLPSGKVSKALYLSQRQPTDFNWYGQSAIFSDNQTGYPIIKTDNDIYTISIDDSGAAYLALDYITALYPRSNTLGSLAQSEFAFNNISAEDCIEFTVNADEVSAVEVWHIESPGKVRKMETKVAGGDEKNGYRRIMVGSPGEYGEDDYAYLMVFNADEELPGVECLGVVKPQNLHSMDVPHMLIVTGERFLPYAERCAALHHKYSGIDVEVVTTDEIYNEFSSGTPSLMALRSMARMLHDRAPEKFRSILLFGPANWDNRYLTELEPEECARKYVPMFVCEDPERAGSITQSYQTDAFVCMLDDDVDDFNIFNCPMTISAGRVPLDSELLMEAYLHKMETLLSAPPSVELSQTALLLSDSGDRSGHMTDSDAMADVIQSVSPSTTVVRCHNSVFPINGNNGYAEMIRNLAIETLKMGTRLMLFTGHSICGHIMGVQHILDLGLFNDNTYDVPPLTFLMTCISADPGNRQLNLTNQLLSMVNGGASGVISSNRTVFKDENARLGLELVKHIYANREGTTYGTVLRDAHNGLIESITNAAQRRRTMANRLDFNLYGDPEFPLPTVSHVAEVTAVDGVKADMSAEEPVVVKGGAAIDVEGVIKFPSGDIDESFSGTVKVNIYESPREYKTVNGLSNGEVPATTRLDHTVIASKMLTVNNGRFSGEIFIPEPLFEGDSNRMQLFASGDGGASANGMFNRLKVLAGGGQTVNPASAPVITDIYIDSPEFADGDVVSGYAPELIVKIAPDARGILAKYPAVGRDMAIIVDGGSPLGQVAHLLTALPDGSYEVRCPLGKLSDGQHTVSFSISNVAGLTAHASVNFIVVNSLADASLVVTAESGHDGLFIIDLDTGCAPMPDSARVVVCNSSGDAVVDCRDAVFPFKLNLAEQGKDKIPRGVYTVRAYLQSGRAYGTAGSVEFVIHY